MSAKWLGWRKLEPTRAYYQELVFLRSPGCEEKGLFTQQKAFNQHFLHTFNLLKDSVEVPETNLKKQRLEGYLSLTLAAGTDLIVLKSPDNLRYLHLLSPKNAPDFVPPAGWTLSRYGLDKGFQLQFQQIIENLESPEKHVFMGPLPTEFKPLAYGKKR